MVKHKRLGYAMFALVFCGAIASLNVFAEESIRCATGITSASCFAETAADLIAGIGNSAVNDITLKNTIVFSDSMDIDITGKTITSGNFSALSIEGANTIVSIDGDGEILAQGGNVVELGAGATANLKGGTLKMLAHGSGYGFYIFGGSTLNMTGGVVDTTASYGAAVGGNNTTGDMNFIMSGGELKSQYQTVFMPSQVNLKISGGTLNGGIYVKMGQIEITGGTINGIASASGLDALEDYYNLGDGYAWLGDAIAVQGGQYSSANPTYGNSLNIKITGGKISAANGSALLVWNAGKIAQDMNVEISGGTFSSKAGVDVIRLIEDAHDIVPNPAAGFGVVDNEIVTTISGGEYSSEVNTAYIADGYDEYDKGPDGPYFVDVETTVDLPDSLFLQVGEAETVTLSEVAKKYGTFGNSSDVATLSDTTITADKVGSGLINFNLHNYKNPIDRNINVVVYEVTPGENSDIDETSQNVLADFVGRQISELLKSGKTTNGKIAFNSNNLDDLKVRLASGQTIKTVLYVDYKYDEDEYEYADAHDKIMAELGENEKILAMYDVYADIYSSDGTYLGYVLEMDTPLPFVIDTSLESLAPSIDLEPADGYTREFSVIRGHYAIDGETSAARVDFVRDGSKFTITSDKYSTFVLTYVDTAKAPDTGVITRQGGSAMGATIVASIVAGSLTMISSFIFITRKINARKN